MVERLLGKKDECYGEIELTEGWVRQRDGGVGVRSLATESRGF